MWCARLWNAKLAFMRLLDVMLLNWNANRTGVLIFCWYGLSKPIVTMMLAPRWIATPTGIGSDMKPSTRTRPSTGQGRKMYGIAIEARIASTIEPLSKTTCSPVWKSVAVR